MSLQLRRETNTKRLTITPDQGELFYCTDTNTTWIGDGSTIGGIKPKRTGSLNYSANPSNVHLGREDSGGVFSNEGAAGSVTFFMDDTESGVDYRFILVEAQNVNIDPPAGTTIQMGATVSVVSTGIKSATPGAWAHVIATSPTTWLVIANSSGWTFI